MTELQARLFAGRALRAAQQQEELARELRPASDIPAQRSRDDASTPTLTVVPDPA
ncbi:MAG: hypothetical protein ACRDOW_08450 [Nocardioidaceae bacterium]|jgi:hypothetical protein